MISGFSEIQVRGPLVNQAKAKKFRPGVIRSGRHTGNPQHLGLILVKTSNQAQTTESVVSQPFRTGVSSAAKPSLGAVPRVQDQTKVPKKKRGIFKAPKKSKAPTTTSQEYLEFKDSYAEDQNPAGSYFTPDSKYLGWAAQFERKLRGAFSKTLPHYYNYRILQPTLIF